MLEYKIVKRKVEDLKPDPNQPRKSFKQEDINLLAQTYQSQGIINPIEIDAENVIITGEMRWRAAKQAKLQEIECKLLNRFDDIERLERQTIENIHHHALKDKELKDVINKLWNSNRYDSHKKLAEKVSLTASYVSSLIRLPKAEREIGIKTAQLLKSTTITEIDSGLNNKIDKQNLAKKAVEEKLTRDQVRKVIREVKKLPKEVKEEVLKPKAEITIEEAKEIAEFPEPEQRKNVMKQIKQTKQASKKIIERKKEIVKDKSKAPVYFEDLDEKFLKIWRNIAQDIQIKMRKGFLKPYNKKTKQEAFKIVKGIVNFLIKEFSEEVNIIGEN